MLMTGAAYPGSALKFMRPARKSSFEIFSVEATNPATSILALAPKNMPFGLIRKTRPFDCKVPRMIEGSTPTTRLSTVLAADCWMKRVVSAAPIENCCQLMIAPGVLMTDNKPPLLVMLARPLTTVGPTGFAYANRPAKHAATATVTSLLPECFLAGSFH